MVNQLQIVSRDCLSRGTRIEMKEMGITVHYFAVDDKLPPLEFERVTINMTGAVVLNSEFFSWLNYGVFPRMSQAWHKNKHICTIGVESVNIQITDTKESA